MEDVFLVHQIKVFAGFIHMKSNSYTMACPPYVKIIHELKRVDYITYRGINMA